MINNISNSPGTPSPLTSVVNTQRAVNSHKNIIRNIDKVYGQLLSLEKLPTEIIQKIAFDLDTGSYDKLRATSNEMRSILPSYTTMKECVENGFTGEQKKRYELMLENKLVDTLTSKIDFDTLIELKYVSVCQKRSHNHCGQVIAINCLNNHDQDITFKAGHFDGFNETITDHPNISSSTYTELFMHGYAKNTLELGDSAYLNRGLDLNIETIDIVFKYLNQETEKNKLVMAMSAHKLMTYLKNTTPGGISANDLAQCEYKYPELFKKGEIIANYISKLIVEHPFLDR